MMEQHLNPKWFTEVGRDLDLWSGNVARPGACNNLNFYVQQTDVYDRSTAPDVPVIDQSPSYCDANGLEEQAS